MTDEEIMSKPHWAIISNTTIHHEGDERSRTNPGHGYPAHSTTIMEYTPYATEEALLAAVLRRDRFVKLTLIRAMPVKTELKISII